MRSATETPNNHNRNGNKRSPQRTEHRCETNVNRCLSVCGPYFSTHYFPALGSHPCRDSQSVNRKVYIRVTISMGMSDSRPVDSIFDVNQEDAEHAHELLLLVRGLREHLESKEEYERPFDPQDFALAESSLNALWQSLAVLVAKKQAEEITVSDVMQEIEGDS